MADKEKKKQSDGGSEQPAPRPRLLEYYQSSVRAKLQKEFGLGNIHEVPALTKIVLNVGMGGASKNPKALDAAVSEMAAITGQKPVVTKAKKAISNFSLRAGMPVGCSVTLRKAKMWEFLDRFISVTVPRFRDFRGLPTRSFDGRGNYSVGIKEQMVFAEVDYDSIEGIHGLDITFVTSTDRDDMGRALLRELGMPFRGETPVAI
ncbi:MAG: 50S ribosomal protein L5 [Gemmatimonadota bacterium]|nr:50S ribosomal protein L5 [Gemmatimonadota bacterium]MDH5803987.1 50S ribosomal protein L5 [Gemmatimonadota bacterium]